MSENTHPIRFGLQTGQQNIEWSQMLDLWQRADDWGYDSLWNFDHFFPIFTPPEGPCLEGWTTLAALAQATRRARIGQLVNGNTYRNPCLTAKMAATVDHISGGRFNLGIGAGWFEHEHRALGIDFKTVRARLEALEESCQILRSMFTEKTTTFRGKHYTVTEAFGEPKPLQKPYPPIMIGGSGEKILLRLVARFADMWNVSASAERMQHLIGVIERHCQAVGRDPAQIEKTVMMPLCYRAAKPREDFVLSLMASMRQSTTEAVRKDIMIGDKDECLETVARFRDVGVTHFIFMTFAPYEMDEIQGFAEEVMPAARALGRA